MSQIIPMSYTIVDIDITLPVPDIPLNPGDTGLGLIIRRNGRPVGYCMSPVEKNVLPAEEASQYIGETAAHELLRETLRDEIAGPSTTASNLSLSVAICTKDRPDDLRRCLESLRHVELPENDESLFVEVLVIDNAPSDDRVERCVHEFTQVRYIKEPRPGLDFARNRALIEARGEWIAYLDDDVVVDRYWLVGLAEALTLNPDAVGFTGLVLPAELKTEAQILFETNGGFRRGFKKKRYQGPHLPGNPLYPCGPGIFGAGANMAFRRSVLMTLGGFDEALDTGASLPGGGDLDIFYRVIRSGYALVYEPRYLVFHRHRPTLTALRRQYWSWGLGFMAFLAKTYSYDVEQRPKLRKMVDWWFKNQFKQLIRGVMGRHVLPPGMILAELKGGIQGLFGEYNRSQKRIQKIVRTHPGGLLPEGRHSFVPTFDPHSRVTSRGKYE